ncbi:MAG: hypothetical protein J7K54_00245 [Candidatus Aenigmarchaeota archaeon]|nr:hypothetical protein [Candidatus Aenigmarchaeota archaeon]
MVSKKVRNGRTYFLCDMCGLAYGEMEKAVQCESWCREHPGSCNPDVVKFAVQLS